MEHQINAELYRVVENRIELMAQTLLTRGGDPNYSGPGGKTLLHCAVHDRPKRPKLEIVNQLLVKRQMDNLGLHFS